MESRGAWLRNSQVMAGRPFTNRKMQMRPRAAAFISDADLNTFHMTA
jgi:hypothetical protein